MTEILSYKGLLIYGNFIMSIKQFYLL